jgi:hypothetical protein
MQHYRSPSHAHVPGNAYLHHQRSNKKEVEPKGIKFKMMATNVRVHHEHCIPARPREKSVLPLAATDAAGKLP